MRHIVVWFRWFKWVKKVYKKSKNYDVIITTGGISMGDADFVFEAFFRKWFRSSFSWCKYQTWSSNYDGKNEYKSVVICLPGNPLTAMVNIYLFVIPMLKNFKEKISINDHGFTKAINQTQFKTKSGR